MKRTLTVVILAAAALTIQAQSGAPRPPKTLKYLTASEIDPSRLLPPPPKDGSEAQQREMNGVKHLIATRTKERYAQATWDAEHEDATPFAAVIGPGFDLKKLPATAKLLDSVLNDQAIAA